MDELVWQQLKSEPLPAQEAETAAPCLAVPAPDTSKAASFTNAIAEAKRKLGDALGIASEKIEITIRL